MLVATYLNKEQYKKYRKIVKQLKTTDGKLLKSLIQILLENPNQLMPQLTITLSASKEPLRPHSKPSTHAQKAPKT
jgi:hypothetical protein